MSFRANFIKSVVCSLLFGAMLLFGMNSTADAQRRNHRDNGLHLGQRRSAARLLRRDVRLGWNRHRRTERHDLSRHQRAERRALRFQQRATHDSFSTRRTWQQSARQNRATLRAHQRAERVALRQHQRGERGHRH